MPAKKKSSVSKSQTKGADVKSKSKPSKSSKTAKSSKKASPAKASPAKTSSKSKKSTKVAKSDSKTVAKSDSKSKSTKTKATKSTKKSEKKAEDKKVVRSTKKATKKTTKKSKAVKKEPVQKGGSKTRYFKVIVEDGDPHGRFCGSKPKQAANKALTSILKSMESDGKKTDQQIRFSIVECTRNSRHKQYNYIGERIELDEPMEVTIRKGGVEKIIKYKYNNKVMKDKNYKPAEKNEAADAE